MFASLTYVDQGVVLSVQLQNDLGVPTGQRRGERVHGDLQLCFTSETRVVEGKLQGLVLHAKVRGVEH